MNVSDAIQKRRCVREYSDKNVKWDDLSEILEAGIRAPNAGNLQNWRFIVVDRDDIKNKLAVASLKQMWMAPAPYLIVVCSDDTQLKRYYSKKGEEMYPIQNCACAIENMLLLATEKGIDSGWVSTFEDDAVRRILRIPSNIRPHAILTFGYGKHVPKEPTRRFGLDKVTFFNEYGGAARVTDKGIFPIARHKETVKKEGKSFLERIKGIFKKKEEPVVSQEEINNIWKEK